MKALIALSFLTLQFTGTLAQRQVQNAIKMTSTMIENPDMADLLLFQDIEFHKIQFRGATLIGKHYAIVAKEIWNGEVKRADTIINTRRKGMKVLDADSLNFKVVGTKTAENKLKVMFFFSEFGIQRQFDATPSADYSLRSLHRGLAIEPGTQFYALAYILPYEADGYKMYCAVDTSGKDVESWGREFGIPHYLIFEMSFF